MLYIIARPARNCVGMCSSRSSFYGMPSRVDQDEERPYQGDLADMLRSITGATTRRYSDSYWTHPPPLSHDKFITETAPGDDDDDDPRLFTFQQPDCVDLGGNDPFSASMIRDLLQHGDDDTMISTNNHLYYTNNLLQSTMMQKSNGHGAGSSSSYLNSSSAGTSSSVFEATTEAASITNCIANRPANNSNVFSPVTHAPAPPTSLQTLSLPSSSFAVAGGSGDANNGAANLLSDAVHISTPRNPAIKRRKSLAKKVVCVSAPSPANSRPSGEVVPSDLWAWRKYGQKPIKGSPYPRGYYRCSSSKGCSARKQVERSRTDPDMLVITYTSEHNHPWPTQRNALAGSTRSHSHPSKNNIRPTSSNASRTGAKDGKCNVEEEETARDELTGAAHQTIEVLNTGGGASATYEDWCSQRIYRPTITVGQPDYYYQHVEQTQDDFFAEFGEKDALSYLDWPSSEHQLPLNDGVPEETKI